MFNYFDGSSSDVASDLRCFNSEKTGCTVKSCNKPLNKELSKNNFQKFKAEKETEKGSNGNDNGNHSRALMARTSPSMP